MFWYCIFCLWNIRENSGQRTKHTNWRYWVFITIRVLAYLKSRLAPCYLWLENQSCLLPSDLTVGEVEILGSCSVLGSSVTILKISQPVNEAQSTQFALENRFSFCRCYQASLICRMLKITLNNFSDLVASCWYFFFLLKRFLRNWFHYWKENDCFTASLMTVNT